MKQFWKTKGMLYHLATDTNFGPLIDMRFNLHVAFWQIAKQQQKFCNEPLKVDNMRVFGFLIYKLCYMDSPYIHTAKGKVNLSFQSLIFL